MSNKMRGWNSDNHFVGVIDELSLWEVELDAGFIQNNWNKELDPSTDKLLHYWKFNEPSSADMLIDSVDPNGALNRYWDAVLVPGTDRIEISSTGPGSNQAESLNGITVGAFALAGGLVVGTAIMAWIHKEPDAYGSSKGGLVYVKDDKNHNSSRGGRAPSGVSLYSHGQSTVGSDW